MKKEFEKYIDVAKKISEKYYHNYVDTGHFMLALLENEEYEKLLNVNKKEFEKKWLEIVGKEKKEKIDRKEKSINNIISPRLEYLVMYKGHEEIDEIIYDLLENDGVAQRVYISIKGEDAIEEVIKKIDNKNRNKNMKKVMPKYLTNLNEKKYITNPAIGREIIIEEIEKIILKMNKPNVLLLGDAGVGKTAIVEGLAYKIANGNVNDVLKNKIILSVSTSSLVSGTKYRGEFEEKIEILCDFLKKYPDVILFIDEMHTSVNAGGAEGAIDMANILKPYLARGDIKVIGATTIKESSIITNDEAYNRRFTKILVKEPKLKTVTSIIEKSIPKFEDFYKIKIDKKYVDYIVTQAEKLDGKFPDKAIDLLENCCADAVWHEEKTFEKKDINRIMESLIEKNKILKEIC